MRAAGLVAISFHLLLFAALAFCQAPASPSRATERSTSSIDQEPVIVERFLSKFDYQSDGTFQEELSARIHVQTDVGVQRFGLLTFSYPKANATMRVAYVRVLKSNGTTVVTPDENVQDMPADVTRAAPFYSDIHEFQIAVKGLSPGDTLEYSILTDFRSPVIPAQFWWAGSLPKDMVVLDERLQLSYPRDKYVQVKSSRLQPTISESGGRRIYTWKTSVSKPEKPTPVVAGKAPAPAILWTTFHDWKEVGRWYQQLQADRVTPTPELRAKALEISKDAKTDSDKVRAIYDYVSTQFRYIGVAFGIGRYQPHSAPDILANEYGDCKDKHTLFAALLKSIGLTAYPALVNTGGLIDPDVPAPIQFDHVISVVPLGKDLVWLDTTPEVAPFALLLRPIRDKQALLIPDDGPARLDRTPAAAPFPVFQHWDITGKIETSGTLEADFRVSLRGDAEVNQRAVFRRAPQSQWNDVVQAIARLNGYGGAVSDAKVSPPERTAEPFTYSFHYVRKDFPDWQHHQLATALPPGGFPLWSEEDKDQPLQLRGGSEITYAASIRLPSGYIPRLPSRVDITSSYAEYHTTYAFKDGALVSERHIIVKVNEIDPAQRDDYSDFQTLASDDENRLIDIYSENASTAAPAPGKPSLGASADNTDADRLMQEGQQALQRHDFREAEDSFRAVLAADPKHAGAWMGLGFTQFALNNVDGGIDSVRKEIANYPNEIPAYKVLGSALNAAKRFDEATTVWRDLISRDPYDRDAPVYLGGLLLRAKKYQEAITVLQSAAALNPKSAGVQVNLGTAYVEAGDADKGLAAYNKAFEIDSDPEFINDAAYELAEKDQKLPDALRLAQDAVKQIEEKSATIVLDNLRTADLGTAVALHAFWDTLGWVYYKTGDFPKAEDYLHAAWINSQDLVPGEHLAEVYEKEHKDALAIDTYALATASNPDYRQNHERLDKLVTPARAGKLVNEAGAKLAEMRRVSLGRSGPTKGSAEFFVLFSPDKIEGVRFVSGDETLKSLTQKIATARFHVAFPSGSTAHLLRRVAVVCSQFSGCDAVLFRPDDVHSLQ